jgi:hypothetical protein
MKLINAWRQRRFYTDLRMANDILGITFPFENDPEARPVYYVGLWFWSAESGSAVQVDPQDQHHTRGSRILGYAPRDIPTQTVLTNLSHNPAFQICSRWDEMQWELRIWFLLIKLSFNTNIKLRIYVRIYYWTTYIVLTATKIYFTCCEKETAFVSVTNFSQNLIKCCWCCI